MNLPVFYSFRRCPYAMRARLALVASGQPVELREILLRDKPQAFLDKSASATVPCLSDDALVLDESLEIMIWALNRNDPLGWLDMPDDGHALIAGADGPFKEALDRTKYANRYPDSDPRVARDQAHGFLAELETKLAENGALTDKDIRLADMAILPFVRQFAFIDKPLFDAQPWPHLHHWLDRFLASDLFAAIMPKFPVWSAGDTPLIFPKAA